MKELLNLQKICLDRIKLENRCINGCSINFYCQSHGCKEGDCSRCLNNIQYQNPTFHYSCKRITYHYTLRFFNRFASEIVYMLNKFNYNDKSYLNVVSLGCGPGSEIYGILKTFMLKNAKTILHYEGHDLVNHWESVQKMSKECLRDTEHTINFYTTDLFTDYHGFQHEGVDLLILNYLLSDAALFMTNNQKTLFIEQIANFVVDKKVKNIFFNDNSYYGYSNQLNSGTQLMNQLIQTLKKQKELSVFYFYFEGDKFQGPEKWVKHTNNELLFSNLEENDFIVNISCCNSKQIFVHIK